MPRFEEGDNRNVGPKDSRRVRLKNIQRRIVGDKYDTENKLREALSRLLQELKE